MQLLQSRAHAKAHTCCGEGLQAGVSCSETRPWQEVPATRMCLEDSAYSI